MNNLGMLLLAVFLIVTGVKTLVGFTFPYDHVVYGVLAIAAGVLILLKK
jgi:hypothetical protein